MPTTVELVALGGAGVIAGAVNAVAGGGSLLTFPALVATGLPPLTANVSNTIAQLPGYASVVNGYRPELVGQAPRLRRLAVPMLLGAAAGVALLAVSSDDAFEAIVPWLVLAASALLALGPRIRAALSVRDGGGRGLTAGVFVCGVYAAYFGAAVGVILLAVLAIAIEDAMQRLNALNRALVLIANLLAAPALALLAPVDWSSVAVLAPATLVGGDVGARLVRRLDDGLLRGLVVVLGVCVAVWLLIR